jgi:hypothetical protein
MRLSGNRLAPGETICDRLAIIFDQVVRYGIGEFLLNPSKHVHIFGDRDLTHYPNIFPRRELIVAYNVNAMRSRAVNYRSVWLPNSPMFA